jgi:hypothetical protein
LHRAVAALCKPAQPAQCRLHVVSCRVVSCITTLSGTTQAQAAAKDALTQLNNEGKSDDWVACRTA